MEASSRVNFTLLAEMDQKVASIIKCAPEVDRGKAGSQDS